MAMVYACIAGSSRFKGSIGHFTGTDLAGRLSRSSAFQTKGSIRVHKTQASRMRKRHTRRRLACSRGLRRPFALFAGRPENDATQLIGPVFFEEAFIEEIVENVSRQLIDAIGVIMDFCRNAVFSPQRDVVPVSIVSL